MTDFYYQVGGSLTSNAPSYIARQADQELYTALQRSEFCYVLNSRQMGKSSLLVQTRYRLQAEGYACAVIDMTNIGSENITPLQWYKGVIRDLQRGFKALRQFQFKQWWEEQGEELSLLQRLSCFIGDVLLKEVPDQPIVIFIDEIDSILSLPFSVDDFFALIRHCYHQRSIDPAYNRLNFALFGVATPSDLIRDRQRTPFNIGTAIALSGFTFAEAQPLTFGLAQAQVNVDAILAAVLNWTNGQPFLTQKLFHRIAQAIQSSNEESCGIATGRESEWVDWFVGEHFLQDWERQDEPEHLRTIRNRILHDPQTSGRLLGLYQQVLDTGFDHATTSPLDRSTTADTLDRSDYTALILSGLAIQSQGQLVVKNRLYAEVFDRDWVNRHLSYLRPYSQLLTEWLASGQQDASRLLRGQALLDAQQWAQGKRLSDDDYQFLAASAESDRQQMQQALEADRVKAIEAQLAQEKRNVRLQRWFLITHSIGLLTSLGLAVVIFMLYRQSQASEQHAKVSQGKALVSSSEGSFDSHRQLDSLVQALQARAALQSLSQSDPALSDRVKLALQQALYGIDEANRLTIDVGVNAVTTSPDGKWIAAACADGSLRLWKPEGTFVRTVAAHHAGATSVAF
ncbi:MAG TPA: AAA-like domain-containing protein, partial [Stenomitos sp.]